ncbi:MAG: hypothetical protein ACI9F9_002667 [Candidatus Paceibacteria bacterium]|jgi:hypothetical protein
MIPILVSKLQNAPQSVLRNVREELAILGEPALLELARMVRRRYGDRHSAHTIGNALGVFEMSEASAGAAGQELLQDCLGHPQDTVRNAAIRALSVHASPGLYEDLRALLPVVKGEIRGRLLTAMFRSDRRRAESMVATWIEAGSHLELMDVAGRLVAHSADEQTAALFAPLLSQIQSQLQRAFFSAAQSRAGDESPGMKYLESLIGSEAPQDRMDALMALEFSVRLDLVAGVLVSDEDPYLRSMACGGLVQHAANPIAKKALDVALNDEDAKIREVALKALLSVGDERARDSAIELWKGAQQGVGIVTRAMAGNWEQHPGLSQRVLKILTERFETRSGDELARREFLIQSIAQIPGPESSRYLLAMADSEVESVKGLSAHRFLSMQVSNTGLPGHRLLREQWRQEQDPARRFDLLWAATLGHDESTSVFLIEVLQAQRSLPHERLWSAERLAAEGPASSAAPIIKRANLRMNDRDFRPAMECLLWRWYG